MEANCFMASLGAVITVQLQGLYLQKESSMSSVVSYKGQ